MPPVWESSAFKRSNVQRHEAVYAVAHSSYDAFIDDDSGRGGVVHLFIGPRHDQTSDEVEILVREYPDQSRPASVFHVMRLGPKFRRFREEHPSS